MILKKEEIIMKKSTKSMIVLGIGAIALLASCGDSSSNSSTGGGSNNSSSSSNPVEDTEFYVTFKGTNYTEGSAISVTVGEGVAILVPHMIDGSEQSFVFTSSDADVVSVNQYSGLMSAKKAGSATVAVQLASDANAKMEFAVTVTDSVVATNFVNYTDVKDDNGEIDYDEKARILGTLERYAVENYLTGITLFSNGSKILYNDRYVPLPKSYVTGYGWGTTREGSLKSNLTNALGGHPDYYTIGTTALPAHANAMNASGSDVSTVYDYIADSYYETRLNVTNDGYEWYPKLANDARPIPIDENGNEIAATDPRAENNSRWRIHVKTGANTSGAYVYRTSSTKSKDGTSLASFNGRQIKLEDYLTPLKMMLTNWNGQYRGSELTDGVSGFVGAASYFNKTSVNKTGDSTALWDETIWNETMGDNIKIGTDAKGEYIEFNLLQPCTQFYAMYYLSSNLYSPLPADFIKLWTPKRLGKSPDGYSPADTMLSTGPYYIEAWDSVGNTAISFKKNDRYFYTRDEDGEFKTNPRNVYQINGIQYNSVQEASNLKNYFLAGQLDSYAPNKDDLANEMKDDKGSNANMSWTAYQTEGDSNFKLNVNASTAEQWKERFGTAGTIKQHSKDEPSDGSYSKVKPYMSNIHFLNFLSFALDRNTICTSRGMTPTQEYFSDNYIIDPERGVSYNSTDAHKAVLANRYNETYGYNKEAAISELKQVFDTTLKDMSNNNELATENSSGTPGTKANPYLVPLDVFWMNPTDITDYADVFDSIKAVFNELSNSRTYNGRYKLQINTPTPSNDFNAVYDRMRAGDFDLGFGAVTGNALNPLNFLEVLRSDNSSGFTLNWGPDTDEVTDQIVYDGKKWSFDSLWTAANSGAVLTNTGDIAQVQNVSTNYAAGLYHYDAINNTEKSVTYKISFKQLIEGGAKVEDVKDMNIAINSASASKIYILNGTPTGDEISLNISAATDWTGNIVIGNEFNTIIVTDDKGVESTENNNVVTLQVNYKIVDNNGITHNFSSSITLLTYNGVQNSR